MRVLSAAVRMNDIMEQGGVVRLCVLCFSVG